jgi:hypothetical protein
LPIRALTFSVAQTKPHRAFHPLSAGRLAKRDELRRARADNTAHRLKNAARNSPERLRSLLLDLAAERITHFDLFKVVVSDSSTLFTGCGGPAVSGTGSHDPASAARLFRRAPEGARRLDVRDTLLRSLQPTDNHEHPPISRFPSLSLARVRSALRPPPHHACAYTR